MTDEGRFDGDQDPLTERDRPVDEDVSRGPGPEDEVRHGETEGEGHGLVGEVKEKGEELLDKISGPDIPPSLEDEDRGT